MHEDQRGLALTTGSAEAAQHFSTAIDRYFEYRLDTMAHVKAALEADPDFVMGRCLRGLLFMLFGTMSVHGKVRDELAFSPSYSFESGLAATARWYLENREWCERVQAGTYSRERLGLKGVG